MPAELLVQLGCLVAEGLFRAFSDSLFSPGVTREQEQTSGPRWETAQGIARRRVPEAAERLAVKLRGSVQSKADPPGAMVSFTIQGHAAQLQWSVEHPLTRVIADLKGHSPGLLKIFPHSEGMELTRRFGMKIVQLGKKKFDKRFVVQSEPEDLSARIFDPEHRGRLLALIRLVPRWWEGKIDLSRETFVLFVPISIWRDACLLNLVAAASELVDRIREVGSSTALSHVRMERREGGECQVCGTEIRDGSVSCARCGTPHHKECWLYLERCSTFGCGETRFK